MERTRASRRASRATSKPCSVAACTCNDIHSRNQAQRAGAERAAINAPMQGTAADIIKRAMVDVDDWLAAARRARALMIMQVHDELVFEVDDGFVDTLLTEVLARMAGVPPSCGCRWWSKRASERTGTRPIEAASGLLRLNRS